MNCPSFRALTASLFLLIIFLDLTHTVEVRRRSSRPEQRPPRKRQAGNDALPPREGERSEIGTTPPPYYPGYRSSSRFCYGAGEGFHPNPEDCTRFIRCVRQGVRRRGRGLVMTRYDFDCAPGTVYDPDIEVCNFPGEGGTPEDCGAVLPVPEPEPGDVEPKRQPTTTKAPEPPTTTITTTKEPPTTTTTPMPSTTTTLPPTTTTMEPPCHCNMNGTLTGTTECDPETRACACKQNVAGLECDRCKRSYFNFEQENPAGCSPCFCFGHSKDCESAVGYIFAPIRSQFAKKIGAWKAEDGSTGASVDLQWVKPTQEISATASTDEQTIYFLTPASYLGEQRRTFGRALNFTMYTKEPPTSASAKEPVIVIEGSGLRVTLSTAALGPQFPSTVSQNYSAIVHPDHGWEPRLTEPQFLVLLSNVTAVKIKGTYAPKGTTYLDNVFMETARRPPPAYVGPPAPWVEECTCPAGYLGLSCEDCAPGHMRKKCGGNQLHECVPCDCEKLKMCAGEAGERTRAECGCPELELAPEPLQAPPTTTTSEATTPAPTTTTTPAPPCECNTTGALAASQCHPGTSDCVCKANVEGRPCDTCVGSNFNLDASNPAGCQPCFCFGHTTSCHSAHGYNFLPVRSVFDKKFGKWRVQNAAGEEVQIQWNKAGKDIKAVATAPDQALFFIAPDTYIGEQRRSLGKWLNFTLYVDEGGFVRLGDEDVVLEGNGLRASLVFFNENRIPGSSPQNYSVRLHPDAGWEPALTEPQWLKLLSRLTVLKIRGTYSEKGATYLDNVFLETARKLPGGEPVGWVEECDCPPGYAGLSCEECASGYERAECGGDYFSKCVPCDCSSRKCPPGGEVHNSCTC